MNDSSFRPAPDISFRFAWRVPLIPYEMERVGAVKRVHQKAFLEVPSFQTSGDEREAYSMLGADLLDLSRTVEENVSSPIPQHLHSRTEYDNVPSIFSRLPMGRAFCGRWLRWRHFWYRHGR